MPKTLQRFIEWYLSKSLIALEIPKIDLMIGDGEI